MSDSITARIVYLVAFPHIAPGARRAGPPVLKKQKYAPYFLALDIEMAELGQSEHQLDGRAVTIRRQLIDEYVQSIECSYFLSEALSQQSRDAKLRLHERLRDQALAEAGYAGTFVEEYVVVCLEATPLAADEFVDSHRAALAALLRSQALSEAEATQTLISRVHYTDHDLTVVDWEGALLIDPEGDFQSDIELLKIGNYQLLRYRLLDRAIERNLLRMEQELKTKRRFNFSGAVLREALEQRLELLLDFEKTEEALLLIGDWYTAQLYRLIVDEFYIDEWKSAVRGKLDQLESITDTVRENFVFSWRQLLDLVQIVGWLLLLIGYFVLFVIDVWGVGK